jgi:hypothetical protein
MKIFIGAAAAFVLFPVFALTAFASESIDSAGNIKIAINAPSAAVAKTAASQQVYVDSNGYLSVGIPRVAAAAPAANTATDSKTCLDSNCSVQL